MIVEMIRDAATALIFAALLSGCSESDGPLDGNDPSDITAEGDNDQLLDGSGDDDTTGSGDTQAGDDDEGDHDAPPAFCNALDAQQDRCGAWTERDAREACDMSDEQAQCVADVLIELEASGTSSCVYPRAMKAVCIGGQITLIGVAKCFIEECFELTTAEACLGNLDFLCDYLP